MKLDVNVNEVVLSNTGAQGEFKIRNSAKAFKILSDGLYSNKIRAVIRELSCNAVDSHTAASKSDVPFEVHLPSMMEPWFSVRDFGVGLSGDAVVNIYTTYFESTKTDSNDFIGALGLGSKSPFSYTENFTVTAIKSGTKRIYSAFINEVGVPSITEMSEELTDEQNGVEVKFSVTDRYDYESFKTESQNIFKWFKLRPNIIGVGNFVIQDQEYVEKNIVPGVHMMQQSYRTSSIAVMGNIAYPLSKISEPEKHFGSLASLLGCSIVIEFDIGDLDFAASREELSYVPLTINSIRRKLEELNSNLALFIAEKANEISCEWARAEYLSIQSNNDLFRNAVRSYVASTKFPLYDTKYSNGAKTFKLSVEDLKTAGLSIQGFRTGAGSTHTISTSNDYVNNQYVLMMDIPVSSNVIIVLNDLKTGCVSRARYHFNETRELYGKYVYCVSHESDDLEIRQAAYDKLMLELHNPPTILKASTLQKREKVKPLVKYGIMELVRKEKYSYSYGPNFTWTPATQEFNETDTYYYVLLNNVQAIDSAGATVPIFEIKALMNGSGIDDIKDIKVFGVRKSRAKEIAALHNWVHFEDKLSAEVKKLSDAKIKALIATELIDSYRDQVYTDKKITKLVDKDSEYYKYSTTYSAIAKSVGDSTKELVALCARYGKSVEVDKIKAEISAEKEKVKARYPLLDFVSTAASVDVANYINMIDKQEKI